MHWIGVRCVYLVLVFGVLKSILIILCTQYFTRNGLVKDTLYCAWVFKNYEDPLHTRSLQFVGDRILEISVQGPSVRCKLDGKTIFAKMNYVWHYIELST